MLGVVNVPPIPNEVPPVDAAYQLNVPTLAAAPNVTVPGPQRAAGVVEETVGIVLMVAITAVLAEVQPALVTST